MNDKTKLPSEKAEERAAEARAKNDAAKEAADRLRGAMRRTFSTPDGLIVLKYLYDQSGYDKSKVAMNPQTAEIVPLTTAYQAIRETFYINIRKYLNFEILKEVEYNEDQQ